MCEHPCPLYFQLPPTWQAHGPFTESSSSCRALGVLSSSWRAPSSLRRSSGDSVARSCSWAPNFFCRPPKLSCSFRALSELEPVEGRRGWPPLG